LEIGEFGEIDETPRESLVKLCASEITQGRKQRHRLGEEGQCVRREPARENVFTVTATCQECSALIAIEWQGSGG
jgi:hypothetical protein